MRALLVCELGLFTGSRDRTIKLWKETADGFEAEKTFVGHESYVTALQYIPAGLLAGLPDGAIVSGMSTPPEHHGSLTISHASARQLYSLADVDALLTPAGSRDITVKLWNPSTCECIQTLQGHKYQVSIF